MQYGFTLSHFTLPVSFIPIFSAKLIGIIVITHRFKATTYTCHCVDREGFDVRHMRTGALHRWRNETKPSNKLPASSLIFHCRIALWPVSHVVEALVAKVLMGKILDAPNNTSKMFYSLVIPL